jgi:hypothetical protein
MSSSSALFGNQREVNLASTVAMIEDVLVELGHFLNQCRDDREGAIRSWKVHKGSATVRISVIDGDDFSHLRVAAPVMTLAATTDRAALFGHLLELNRELCGAAFAVAGPQVMIVSERSTLDLDRSEVMDTIARVQRYADDHDDGLVADFGGALGGDA